MKKLTALVVDDEFYARKELIEMLKEYPFVKKVFEADSVKQATDIYTKQTIDFILLDIQLMGETGFDLLDQASVTCDVIFITAYDQFAIKAFEVNALDYLLKPVRSQRFKEAMARLTTKGHPVEKISPRLSNQDSLIEKTKEGLKIIPIHRISHITSDRDYSRIACENGFGLMVLRTMKNWESILPYENFKRIHRSSIINLNHVETATKRKNGQYMVQMKGCDRSFPIGRNYLKKLLDCCPSFVD